MQVYSPYIDIGTGDLVTDWAVTTSTPFRPVHYVDLQLSAGSQAGLSEQSLANFPLDVCVLQGNCSSSSRTRFNDRVPVARGFNWIQAIIDPSNLHAETNEDTGDNRRWLFLGNFPEEIVPSIMRNISFTWDLGARALELWFDGGRRKKRIAVGNQIDWELPTNVLSDVDWTLNPINASNSRFVDTFNQLIQPSFFDNTNTRGYLRTRARDKFAANPSATSVSLSSRWDEGDSPRSYHPQHIRTIVAQSSGIGGGADFDAVTAALGGFSYYLVPLGTAAKAPNNKYRIQIDRIAVHVSDSFDFEGFQPLGCWAFPNQLSRFPFPGSDCLFNSNFRDRRFLKASGADYNIFLRPKVIRIPGSLTYLVDR